VTALLQIGLAAPVIGLAPCDVPTANVLLVEWGHYLGPIRRPFGVEPWVLELDGVPISVAVGASTVSATIADGQLRRDQVVELARLCSSPAHRWATRPALRLWREVAAPRWPHWRVEAAVAYSQNARHEGAIYRFDGWSRLSTAVGRSRGGGTWTGTRAPNHASAGAKSLWIWRWPSST
jgi:hypothetical protein